jgi:2-oxoisovalerate dehydrogenase E2 component (dihydrolipoyl transacylase)
MSEIQAFQLPDLGEGLESASIVEWRVEVGDVVALNDPLVVVETAKAEVEIPSPFAGTIVGRDGDEGEEVVVGTTLVRIELDGAAAAEPADAVSPPAVLVGYGPRHDPRPVRSSSVRAKPVCSPPVRKLASDLGVDLGALAPGSGPDGRIVRADVERASGARESAATVIPLRGLRARVAELTTTSRREIPDATAATWADATELIELRERLRDAPELRGTRLTPLALVLRLVVVALDDQPVLNASFDPAAGEIRLHEHRHLGVATSTPKGLVVPVIRHAERRSTAELAAELARLADAAREGTLAPAELRGSTFTVSNAGAFGVDEGIPVINHPEVAILGVGAIRRRPWVVGDEVVARHTVKLTCAFDHRACDGAEAAHFLRRLADLIEQPDRALLVL